MARDLARQIDNDEVARLHRVRHTVFQMLCDRGYAITQAQLTESLPLFRVEFNPLIGQSRETLMILAQKGADIEQRIFVFFRDAKANNERAMGVGGVRTYFTRMRDANVTRAIVVTQYGVTTWVAKAQAELLEGGYVVEIFTELEFLFDVTEHCSVPKHILLTDAEKAALVSKCRLANPTQLPRLQRNDPVARYYGLLPGQVVKIVRDSETAGRYVTHWIVI